jgi:hypothetical protein
MARDLPPFLANRKGPYSEFPEPPAFRRFQLLFGILWGLVVVGSMLSGQWNASPFCVIFAFVVWLLNRQLLRWGNAARLALIILTLPVGLLLMGKKPREYCARRVR